MSSLPWWYLAMCFSKFFWIHIQPKALAHAEVLELLYHETSTVPTSRSQSTWSKFGKPAEFLDRHPGHPGDLPHHNVLSFITRPSAYPVTTWLPRGRSSIPRTPARSVIVHLPMHSLFYPTLNCTVVLHISAPQLVSFRYTHAQARPHET